MLVSTGASEWGTNWKKYPWTIGWQPDYIAEGRLYGTDIRQNKPNAKIAILYQNDSYGKDYLIGFKSALGTAKVRSQIVGEEPFEVTATSPQSQLVRLRASGADTLMIFVTPRPTIQTYAIIRAPRLEAGEHLRQLRLVDGRVHDDGGRLVERRHGQRLDQRRVPEGSGFPDWANDATVKQYLTLMAKYNPRGRTSDGLNFYGFAKAHTFVQAMYKAGKNPTRQGLMRAMLSFNETSPYALPGVRLKSSATDHFIISQQQMMRFNNGGWTLTGKLVDGRPRG